MLLVRDKDLSDVRKLPLGFGSPWWGFVKWPDPGGPWHLAVLDGKKLRVSSLEDGVEKASISGVTGGAFAFLGERIVVARGENRRVVLRVFDAGGRNLYEEVVEPGGPLFAMSQDRFLIVECVRDRCPTVWSYRLP
jgi:hypothetical protein